MIQTNQKTQIQQNQNHSKTSFLGQKLNPQTDALQTLKTLQNDTIWITYRQNFSPLLQEKKKKSPYKQKITTDQGWGCMLRVGQNIFIEALKRHFYKNNIKFNYHQLIQPFIDDPSANYSIHQISEIAFENFQMAPGEWYPPNRIMKVLEILQNSQPVQNAKNLKIASFNSDSVIVYDQILGYFLKDDFLQKPLENIEETFLCKNPEHSQLIQNSEENQNQESLNQENSNFNQENKENSNQQNQNLNQENNNQNLNQNQENNNQNQNQNLNQKQKKLVCQQCHKSEKSLFLVINTRLGLEKINTSYQQIILEILEFELSLGIIGGQTGKAHYFIGNLDKKLLFLDPHFTQPASTKENFGNLENIQSYFCSQLRFLDIEQIDSTLSLGFYLKNLNDFEKFYQFMNQLSEKYQDFFIYFSEEVPSYIKKIYEKKDNQEGQQQEAEDDDFIIID
ncbi:hypothetical protein PPERSA_03056 [Pseudocohnilembus persalinus]|uniref:Cysteine protease n=1 Tax=Pseudocohnilembus persalinus TaxID=266149 RepID=A0A0V0R922_PSEPJ|nr:hypothetical protein PPERSA_03056 [Pseudocohnilembus persalinus]|eukprot:KRX10998.1 hypothetical protein PPERSA_03056 [Pseudocohnilembus persalinus]